MIRRPHRVALPLLVATVLACGALAPGSTLSQPTEILDRIVAVVGDEIILLTEVDEEVLLAQVRDGLDLDDEETVRAYRQQVLEGLIEAKILLAKARAEGVRATRDEVDQSVDRMLQDLRARFPSEEAFAAQMEREGLTLEELRRSYREKVEQQLLISKLVDRDVRSRVEVEPSAVRAYWEEHREEFPSVPAMLELRRILVSARGAAAVDSAATERAGIVLDRLRQGEDFGELARVFSEGPTAERGGDLGWFQAGELEPVLEEAIQALASGEASEVVLSSRGAHILEVRERREDAVRLRQIVFLRDEEAARVGARARAEAILQRLWAGEDFATVAAAETDDAALREHGGLIGMVPVESLEPDHRLQLERLAPGEISGLIENEEGFAIFRLESRQGEREPEFAEIESRLTQVLEQNEAQELYADYVEKARDDTYVTILTAPEE